VDGEATWYAEAPDGMCASPDLSFGTVLTVTDDATGNSITCTVDDREAQNPGRVVDLSPEGFSQLAPTSQGVIMVTVSW
jgi:rare lipoprotein A (peptidoglycan hydrolase)